MKRDIHFGRENLVNSTFTFLWFVAFLGVAFVVSAAIFLHRVKWDLTENQLFTLNDKTQNLLRSLREPATFRYFYRKEPSNGATELFRLYRQANPRISTELVDMQAHPDIAIKYNIRRPHTIAVSHGDRTQIARGISEYDISSALLRTVRNLSRTIYVLQGHGENVFNDKQANGLAIGENALRNDYYTLKPLLLAQQDAVPEDCSLLLVPGPRFEPSAAEIERINAYMARGGNVVLLLDPSPSAQMQSMLAAWGIRLSGQVITDNSRVRQQRHPSASLTVGIRYSDHPAVAQLRSATLFFQATPVSLASQLPERTSARLLVLTDRDTRSGKNMSGPFALAAAATRSLAGNKQSRLVVIGYSDFATNAYLGSEGNLDLFLNVMNWAAGEEDLLGIGAKPYVNKRIDLTPFRRGIVLSTVVFLIPGIPLLIALVLAMRQRG